MQTLQLSHLFGITILQHLDVKPQKYATVVFSIVPDTWIRTGNNSYNTLVLPLLRFLSQIISQSCPKTEKYVHFLYFFICNI